MASVDSVLDAVGRVCLLSTNNCSSFSPTCVAVALCNKDDNDVKEKIKINFVNRALFLIGLRSLRALIVHN